MKVSILVTHLLGTGHLARAAQLGDALATAGHEVLILSGGTAAPNAAPKRAGMAQLPPLRADGPAFTGLLDEAGAVATAAYLDARIEAVRGAVAAFVPDILVTELYPFGRRKLRAEFDAAIEAARGALIFASIRDILQQPRKPGRKEEAQARFAQAYDGALFHGSAQLLPLSASWPLPDALATKVIDTGYIGPEPRPSTASGEGKGEIIVAAGGGAVGDDIFRAAIAAATGDERRWRILVGGTAREARISALQKAATGANVIIQPVRPDFADLLARSDAAILQCGYNTAMDIVATGAKAVFCPFEGAGGETEQLTRAQAFAAQFGSGLVREADLSPQALRAALGQVIAAPAPDYSAIQLDGAARSVAILEAAHDRRGRA